MSVAVEFIDLRKAFGPVQVLHGVSFALQPGRVIGVLGENGAGKSTLMKILAGYETLTGGTLKVNGEPQQFVSSRDAEALGIVLIHQEFNLAEDLSVAQNIFLGHEKKKGWLLDDAAMERDAAANAIVQRAGSLIGQMLASIVNFFNPSHVFIGGGVTRIGPLFLASLRQSVYHRSLALSTRHLEIQYTPLGAQAGLIGAGVLAMHETLKVRGVAPS